MWQGLSVSLPAPPKHGGELCDAAGSPAEPACPPSTEHGKNWDRQGGGTCPVGSCPWRSWEAPASSNIANQPLTTKVMAPLSRAFYQVESPLCFAVGPEKAAVACAQSRAGCVREESEGYLEPAVGTGCFCRMWGCCRHPGFLFQPLEISASPLSFASELTLEWTWESSRKSSVPERPECYHTKQSYQVSPEPDHSTFEPKPETLIPPCCSTPQGFLWQNGRPRSGASAAQQSLSVNKYLQDKNMWC